MNQLNIFSIIIFYMVQLTNADDTNYGVSNTRSAQLFHGIYNPGNYIGYAPQTVPGISLPTQEKRFPDRMPFSPTSSVFGNAAAIDKGNSWGYGQALHGVNPLDLDTTNLYEAYADASGPLHTDGQSFPFDHAFAIGGEYDKQKWKYIKGGMQIPILSPKWPNLFDLTGNYQKLGPNNIGNVDFPLPGTNQRFPLSGHIFGKRLIQTYQFGQAIPNVNPFRVPKEDILQQLENGGNPNPTFVG